MLDNRVPEDQPVPMSAVTRSPKLTEVVADMLRRKIVTGELAEGDFLPPEPELMIQLGISRPTLREALRVLESEALIKPRRGSRTGAQVRAPSVELSSRYMALVLQYEGVTVDDVQKARRTLEPPLAGLLAARKDPAAIELLRLDIARCEALLDDGPAYAVESVRFHERMAELAGVQTLAVCLKQFNWVLERLAESGRTQRDDPGFKPRTGLAHRAHVHFVDMLERGAPPELVEKFWLDHVDAVGDVLLEGRQGERVLDIFG